MSRRSVTVGVLAAVSLALIATSTARPRDGLVAIVSIEITGDGAPELRAQMQRSLAGGLSAGGLRVVELPDVMSALAETPELIGCTSTTCLQRIGEKVGADYFVRARVEATGSAYFVELELLSASVEGGLVTRTERNCPVCTIMEVNDLVSAAAKELVELPPAKPMPVLIVTRPEGATVRVDESVVGTSPHRMNLDVGEHTVAATLADHVEAERTITVTENATEPLTVELELAPVDATTPPVGARDTGDRPFRTWKWVTAGGAAAALITGVALVALDGADACDKTGAQKQCPEVWDTGTAGWLGVAAGVGLGGASTWMFLRDRRDQRRADVAVAPTNGGAVGWLRVTW